MPRTTDIRGFTTYDTFQDSYGAEVRVKESSSAEEPKVWIFVAGGKTSGLSGIDRNDTNDGQAHLNEEQVDKVIAALQQWKKENGSARSGQ